MEILSVIFTLVITYLRHSQQDEVSENSSYLFPWMSSQNPSKIFSVSTGIVSFSKQSGEGLSSEDLDIVKRLGLGPGTWDLGPGTWDLGPGT